ncbi:MAG: pantetheine-phosphate adenylyltransferase [Planctomycetes bacterium]|nr:pantetheine-phosphate adenylyltransferase [Planctomycetota bacterium]
MTRKALYAGSFDPMTRGHLDIIRRARLLADELVVAVGTNAGKKALFSAEERVAMLARATDDLDGVEVVAFSGLVVDEARRRGATILVRGIRSVADFEDERTMALTNRCLAPDIDTIILVPSEEYAFLSSRLVKEVVGSGGNLDRFLDPETAAALRARLSESQRD